MRVTARGGDESSFGFHEEFLMRGIASGAADQNDILRWCTWWPDGRIASSRLEATLFGRLFAPQPEVRRGAYLALAILAKKNALSDRMRQDFIEAVLKFGLHDRHWAPRAGAVVAVSRLAKNLERARLEDLVRASAEDASADVRRASGLVERSLTGGDD